MYQVLLTKSTLKQRNKLNNSYRQRVTRALAKLKVDPSIGKPLHGVYQDYFSLRAWPLRIIYRIDFNSKRVIVHKIAHHQGAY